LIPLIHLAPLLIVWWLPWEAWVWEKLPKKLRKFVGPYLLYVSFVFWHFKFHWWAVLIVLATGIGFSAWTIWEISNSGSKK
jgi:1,4-dihydroxy-2-naphthoate octaprenyltransferase